MKRGTRYFVPFGQAWAMRETVYLLLRVFPMRSCTQGVFNRARSSGRPCLLGDIGKCSAPCVGRVSADEHRLVAEDFCSFMAGVPAELITFSMLFLSFISEFCRLLMNPFQSGP